MFNYLFNKYKLEILGESFWASFKKCKRYEQISISLICIGPVLAALLLFFRVYIISLISFALCLVGLLIVKLFRMKKAEKQRIVEEKILPYANERINKMAIILSNCKIDINDDDLLDELIEYAQKQIDKYDMGAGFKKWCSGIIKYFLIPVFTLFISGLYKDIDLKQLYTRTFGLVMVIAAIGIFSLAIITTFNDLINKDVNYLTLFINDVEEIKIFKNMIEKPKNNL